MASMIARKLGFPLLMCLLLLCFNENVNHHRILVRIMTTRVVKSQATKITARSK